MADKRGRGRVTKGLEVTIRALRDAGRLEAVDAAMVAVNRELAALLEGAVHDPDESRYTCGTLAGRYLTALDRLYGRDDDSDSRPTLADLLAGALNAGDTGPPA
jgi:hypothetical protein